MSYNFSSYSGFSPSKSYEFGSSSLGSSSSNSYTYSNPQQFQKNLQTPGLQFTDNQKYSVNQGTNSKGEYEAKVSPTADYAFMPGGDNRPSFTVTEKNSNKSKSNNKGSAGGDMLRNYQPSTKSSSNYSGSTFKKASKKEQKAGSAFVDSMFSNIFSSPAKNSFNSTANSIGSSNKNKSKQQKAKQKAQTVKNNKSKNDNPYASMSSKELKKVNIFDISNKEYKQYSKARWKY